MDKYESKIVSESMKWGKSDRLEELVAAACAQGWEPVSLSVADNLTPPTGYVLLRRRLG